MGPKSSSKSQVCWVLVYFFSWGKTRENVDMGLRRSPEPELEVANRAAADPGNMDDNMVSSNSMADESTMGKVKGQIDLMARKTGLQPWHVMVVIGLLVCVVVGLCLWCIWRFFSKKRSGAGGKKKGAGGKSSEDRNGTGHMIGDNDEDFLVDNEEEPDAMDIKDEPIKGAATGASAASKEYLGKLQYKLEYDFNSQTLNVTVIQCSELPALDMGGTSDPYVKLYLMPDKKRKFETKVHRKTLNPFFNETFAFKNVPYSETFDKTLVFAVFDYDRFSKHDQIGELKVPLCMVDLAQTIEEWKDLSSVKVDDQYLGDICFSLRYVPTSGKLTVGILECKNLKKMDITGASDPYVKIKLLDRKAKRIGKKKKTSVKMGNLNPYYNESFVFLVEQEQLRRVTLELMVCDYDRIGSSDPIGRVECGYNRKGLELKHWKEMVENPRRPIVHWHVLKDPEPGDDDDDEKKKKKEGEKKER